MKRFRLGTAVFVALAAAIATMLLAAPAGAFHSKNPSRPGQILSPQGDAYQGFDPMETSIPYVAWRGEEIRLVKCFDPHYFEPESHGDPAEGGIYFPISAGEPDETGEWQIMDWSGDAHVWPKFFDDNDQQTRVFNAVVGDQAGGRKCFAIDITSHKPGIAIVKLKVDDSQDNSPGEGVNLRGEGDPVATHQFVVIWMSFQDVRLRNLEGGEGGPLGPITENPLDTNRLGVVVQGRIPLNEQFRTELDLPSAIKARGALVFPEDYPALARTSLAHLSWALQKANNGREGDDNYRNPSCNSSPDGGSLDNPDPNACLNDLDDEDYIPEPRHAPGDLWDIHDSTGPYNTDVYDSTPGDNAANDKPLVEDICPGPVGDVEDHLDECQVDQFVNTFGGGGDSDCDGPTIGDGGPNDTVDNCDPGEWDSVSRVFHDVSGEDVETTESQNEPTIGPYSPTRPDETLLSDSKLNAHDAPMPSALVVVGITPNTGEAGDIRGVGSLLADVDKHVVYNRGAQGDENCEEDPEGKHCVTAPFAGAYIPPSPTMEGTPAQNVPDQNGALDDDGDVASGIHGTVANNFNGYLPVYYPNRNVNRGLYHYWDLVDVLRSEVATDVGAPCPPGEFETPSGDKEIALYTDEHGEAQLTFDAGIGFFPAGFMRQGLGQGCVPRDVLGTAEITANARYPFQPTTSAGATSNTLVKEIESLFDKGIICIPKLEGDPPTVASDEKAFCLVFARDIAGRPLDEVACVTIIGNDGSVEDFLPDPVPGNPPQLDNRVCVDTDQSGDVPPGANTSGFTTAEIEALFGLEDAATYGVDVVLVIGRGNLTADVRFLEENLNFTDEFSIPPVGTTTGASTGQAPTANQHGLPVLPPPVAGTNPAVVGKLPTPSGNGSGTERRSGSVQNPGNQEVLKPAVLKARASLMFVRIVKPLKLGGVRYVVLRVKSPHKNARVQINVVGKRGKVLGTVLRKVKTNRTIRVPNLRLPKAAVTVRAKLI